MSHEFVVLFKERAARSKSDAERPELHAHAEHGHDSALAHAWRSSRSSVATMQWPPENPEQSAAIRRPPHK
ncbi:hypothetical protein CXB36_01085 [Pseudomonas syringae pv. syringae]|nr:hypothetical protein CXB36_01085 [Pseudomonas syringae pv. syringae]